MNRITKIGIVIALILAVGAIIVLKENNKNVGVNPVEKVTAIETPPIKADAAEEPKALPRLVDLGASKCIPCKMMAPILEELKKEYAGIFNVEFIDVWKNPDEGKKYGIRVIPTQIFFDSTGKELFRHSGFFSKEDILATWKKMGVKIDKKQE